MILIPSINKYRLFNIKTRFLVLNYQIITPMNLYPILITSFLFLTFNYNQLLLHQTKLLLLTPQTHIFSLRFVT